MEEGWRGYGRGGRWLWGQGGRGGWERQWVGNSNFNPKTSPCCRNFLPSISFFIHSFTFSSYFLLILTNSSSPFASISLFFLLSFSQFVPSHSTFFLFHFFILAVCSSKSDFYTTNLFPISISVLCKKIRSLSFVLHSLLGRRNFIVGGLVHTSLVRFIIHLENIALFVINQPINQSINWDYKQN